ncbi:MAG: ATP-dependent 6-phosphofructokinase [Candidatus Zophobacter franzmannii]|nr:ATP-dependent 6-phosphofructokinase [Candidatus Zophobacter franzmannii]
MKKRILVNTGGGDCPGLNAVIRAIVKSADLDPDNEWEVIGSIDAYNGILLEPMELMELTPEVVGGIHVQGGTIIGSTNKGGPYAWPIKNADGTWSAVDRSDELVRKVQMQHFDAVISIGGDGSQRISQQLFEKGFPVIGVPKTIDNDLGSTDYTFGFQTAVETATEALDKLVTTAASHHRIQILEVMGRDAGWIALSAAVAGGAEICLIPEIPYDVDKIISVIHDRMNGKRRFANIIIAEGAMPKDGQQSTDPDNEIGRNNVKLAGAALELSRLIKERGYNYDIRETILGHLQRGGTPNPFDRILATQFGVKAFELAKAEKFGQMVAYRHPNIISVPIKDAIRKYKLVDVNSDLVNTARKTGICMGD